MKHWKDCLGDIASSSLCQFDPPRGLPELPVDFTLPDDVREFYQVYGEARLAIEDYFQYRIVGPEEFVPVTEAIYGERLDSEMSPWWYSLVDVLDGNYIAIDLHPERFGHCYDIFHETGVNPGQCKVIALSFTELCNQLAQAGANRLYWLDANFSHYGYL